MKGYIFALKYMAKFPQKIALTGINEWLKIMNKSWKECELFAYIKCSLHFWVFRMK